MLAHVAGLPIEEMVLPLLFSAGALYTGIGAVLTYRRRTREESSCTQPRS
jgi:hypothetical protein